MIDPVRYATALKHGHSKRRLFRLIRKTPRHRDLELERACNAAWSESDPDTPSSQVVDAVEAHMVAGTFAATPIAANRGEK